MDKVQKPVGQYYASSEHSRADNKTVTVATRDCSREQSCNQYAVLFTFLNTACQSPLPRHLSLLRAITFIQITLINVRTHKGNRLYQG